MGRLRLFQPLFNVIEHLQLSSNPCTLDLAGWLRHGSGHTP